jgi:hypothetical protein
MWSEDPPTRVVWVTMLTLKDKFQEVHASLPGLARAANVPLADAEAAIKKFLSPDPYSRTKEHEGRRIEEIPGGWRILNGEYYRRLMSIEERKEYKRIKESERRARLRAKNVDKSGQSVTKNGQNLAETDTEAEAETKVGTKKGTAPTRFQVPSLEEVKLLMAKVALPESEAEKFWNFYESKGWMVGKTKMRRVAGAVANWAARYREWHPIASTDAEPPKTTGSERMVHLEEFKRVEARMNDIRNSYSEHQSWSEDDRFKFQALKERKVELKKLLGMQV